MAFCSNCGTQIPDNSNVCPSCGAPQQGNNAYQQNFQQQAYVSGTGPIDPNDIQQNKVMAVLAYFGFLFLIPLIAAPNSRYARFHTNQGLVLFLCEFALGIIAFIPFIGWIISTLGEIAAFVFFIIGVIHAANGEVKELPLIGKIKILK